MTITFDNQEIEKLPFADLKAMLEYVEEQKEIWSTVNRENKLEKTDKEAKEDLENWHYWSLIEDAINNILDKKVKNLFKEYKTVYKD